MFSSKSIFTALLLSITTNAQTWCGKNYMDTSPIVPPGGQFVFPPTSNKPLLNFQCTPITKPFLKGDTVSLIIDTRITFSEVPGAVPLSHSTAPLEITAVLDGQSHVLGTVPIDTTGTEFVLPTDSLVARPDPYTVNCLARAGDQSNYATSTQILYLNPPTNGSVTKQDYRTGALLVQNGSANSASRWEPILPVGFYTIFGGYLDNLSNIDAIAARGFKMIHIVPDFDAVFGSGDQFEQALDRMEELGLWLMYDMRYTYQNLTSVTQQVNMIKDRSNLLLWYTGDEPDGTSDPLNATFITKELINSLDGGGYHPVSLVLNCQNYYFDNYSLGADVLLQDTYMIGNNVTFSSQWHTPCTPDYGDCGCDNCKGNFQDITTRVDEFKQRLDLLGRLRTTAVWSVPQGFGQDTYWPRYPTKQEVLVEGVISLNHGSLGLVSWDDPTTDDVRSALSTLAKLAPTIISYLATPGITVHQSLINKVDFASWQQLGSSSTAKSLVLLANTNYQNVSVTLDVFGNGARTQILNGGIMSATSLPTRGLESESASEKGLVVQLNATGTAGFIVEGEVSLGSVTLI